MGSRSNPPLFVVHDGGLSPRSEPALLQWHFNDLLHVRRRLMTGLIVVAISLPSSQWR